MRHKIISVAFGAAIALSSVGAAFATPPAGHTDSGNNENVVHCKTHSHPVEHHKNLGQCVSHHAHTK